MESSPESERMDKSGKVHAAVWMAVFLLAVIFLLDTSRSEEMLTISMGTIANGSHCGNVTGNINLVNNININTPTGHGTGFNQSECYFVNTSNVIIDGKGYYIWGNISFTGVNVSNVANVTIKNLVLQNFTQGIFLNNSDNSTIENNSINTSTGAGANAKAIHILSSERVNITQNRLNVSSGAGAFGIILTEAHNATVSGNFINVTGSGIAGISVSQTDNATIGPDNNITALGSAGYCIFLTLSDLNNISFNQYLRSNGVAGAYCIWTENSDNNTFAENNISITRASSYGMSINTNSGNNTIYRTNVTSSASDSEYGIEIAGGAHGNIINSTIVTMAGTSSYGISLNAGSKNRITNSTITNTGNNGMGVDVTNAANLSQIDFTNITTTGAAGAGGAPYALSLSRANHTIVMHSYLNSSKSNDVQGDIGINNTLLNITAIRNKQINSKKLNISVGGLDGSGEILVKWIVIVNVTEREDPRQMVGDVNVSAYNLSFTAVPVSLDSSIFTNYVPPFANLSLTELMVRGADPFFYYNTNHTIFANKSSCTSNATANINLTDTNNTMLHLNLTGCTPPASAGESGNAFGFAGDSRAGKSGTGTASPAGQAGPETVAQFMNQQGMTAEQQQQVMEQMVQLGMTGATTFGGDLVGFMTTRGMDLSQMQAFFSLYSLQFGPEALQRFMTDFELQRIARELSLGISPEARLALQQQREALNRLAEERHALTGQAIPGFSPGREIPHPNIQPVLSVPVTFVNTGKFPIAITPKIVEELEEYDFLIGKTVGGKEKTAEQLGTGVSLSPTRVTEQALASQLEEVEDIIIPPGETLKKTINIKQGVSAKERPIEFVFESLGQAVATEKVSTQPITGAAVDVDPEKGAIDVYIVVVPGIVKGSSAPPLVETSGVTGAAITLNLSSQVQESRLSGAAISDYIPTDEDFYFLELNINNYPDLRREQLRSYPYKLSPGYAAMKFLWGAKSLFSDLYGPYKVKKDEQFIFAQQLKYNPEEFHGDHVIAARLYKGDLLITENFFEVDLSKPTSAPILGQSSTVIPPSIIGEETPAPENEILTEEPTPAQITGAIVAHTRDEPPLITEEEEEEEISAEEPAPAQIIGAIGENKEEENPLPEKENQEQQPLAPLPENEKKTAEERLPSQIVGAIVVNQREENQPQAEEKTPTPAQVTGAIIVNVSDKMSFKNRFIILMSAIIIVLAGCGYFFSRQWTEQQKTDSLLSLPTIPTIEAEPKETAEERKLRKELEKIDTILKRLRD